MKRILYVLLGLAAVLVLVLGLTNNQAEPGSRGGPGSPTRSDGRVLSVDLTAGEGGFDVSYAAATELRTQALSVVFAWDELEPAPETYDPRYLPAAHRAFGGGGMLVTGGINPLDTLTPRTPQDLRGKKLNDPAVVERYKKAVDFYLEQAKELTITAFVVGNEIDGVLGADEARWREYEEFFRAVAPYIRSKLPGVPVGAKVMHAGLTGPARAQAQSLNAHADAAMVTYYPLRDDFSVKPPTAVRGDVDAVMALYPAKPVYFLEFGCPSSPALGSSEETQAEFVREMFRAWDAYAERVPMITFFAMSDLARTDLDRWVGYYGITQGNFREYLGTLGLLRADGTRKKAFAAFKEEAAARGW